MMISVVASLALTLAAPQEGWVASYQAYDAAMAANDREAAELHAREAWEAASQTLPPSENRALLAQNYGDLIVVSNPAAAVAPLEDAVELAGLGYGTANLSAELSQYLLDSARSLAEPDNSHLARTAFKSWQSVSQEELWFPNTLSLQRTLIKQLLRRRDSAEAQQIAASLTSDRTRFDSLPFDYRRDVAFLWTTAVSQRVPSDRVDSLVSYQSFREAIIEPAMLTASIAREFRPAPTFDQLSQQLADIRAWIYISRTLYDTHGGDLDEWQERVGSYPRLVEVPRECRGVRVEWTRRNLNYDPKGVGYWNGVVTAAYDLDDDGKVSNPRIIAEIPATRFSGVVERGLPKWRSGNADQIPERCRKDLFVDILFTVDG
ncbi:MAG: hypothetical protein AAFR65_03805 [Pseudomonadota bacterium]